MIKLQINATLKVLTGLHIGDNSGFAPIGAQDNPVIRDTYTGDPYVPGSSLKGKMRTLLARARQKMPGPLPECGNDAPEIQRVFGSPKSRENNNNPLTGRLQFSDAFLTNREEMTRRGGILENKSENAINRRTSIANPRPMERVTRGCEFGLLWYYTAVNEAELREDLALLAEGCRLLSVDYLGGGGTRGNGRVAIESFRVQVLYGQLPGDETEEKLEGLFKDVSDYAAKGL